MKAPLVAIRAAAADDWESVGALSQLLVKRHHAFDAARFVPPDALPPHDYAARLRAEIARGEATVLVADDHGAVAGYTFAGLEPANWKELRHDAGYIHDLVVAPERRGRGVGSALLDAAIDWFAARGIRRVMLWSAHANSGAQRLFVRAGFRATMTEMTIDLG